MSQEDRPKTDRWQHLPFAAQIPRPLRTFQIRWNEGVQWLQLQAGTKEAAVLAFARQHQSEFGARALIYVREVSVTEPLQYIIRNAPGGQTQACGPDGIFFSK